MEQNTLFGQFKCDYCGAAICEDEIFFQLSNNSKAFWCDECEYCNSFGSETARAQYLLIREQANFSSDNQSRVLNSPHRTTKALKRQLSPLRYAGGKSKMIDHFISCLEPTKAQCLVSPYVGGGSIEFSLLEAGIVNELVINDLDRDLITFYRAVFYDTDNLIDLILNTRVTKKFYHECHVNIVSGTLSEFPIPSVEKAFRYLVNNRCSYSGIYNAGIQGGKNGSENSFLQRYKPKSLAKRIETLAKMRDRVTILNEDALSVIEEWSWRDNTTFIIDPPYIDKGANLYRLAYNDLSEHQALFDLLAEFNHSFPNVDYIIYYDNSKEFENLSNLPLQQQIVGRQYSI